FTPPADHCDGGKENVAPVEPKSTAKRRRRFSAAIEGTSADAEVTPRSNKRRVVHDHAGRPLESDKAISGARRPRGSDCYYDFATTKAKVPDDVQRLRMDIQSLSDGVGILGYTERELARLTGPNGGLEVGERVRFGYAWVNNLEKRRRTGGMVALSEVQRLTAAAITCEEDRSHEGTWNEKVHWIVIQAALASSAHTEYLNTASAKTASIDPKSLASETLPKRVVDYTIVLVPDEITARAWRKLRPLPGAGIKSWNHTTTNDLRSNPIASSIETKAPNKSWTDGKAQLAIWTAAFHKRLAMLQKPGQSQGHLRIPAMPLLIAQGHDWHLLIVSRQPLSDNEDCSETIIWQKIDIGSTRNCFDAY
ncbi:MAG: hypothetical protein LQ345_006824, partial [Seirophora villosa]